MLDTLDAFGFSDVYIYYIYIYMLLRDFSDVYILYIYAIERFF